MVIQCTIKHIQDTSYSCHPKRQPASWERVSLQRIQVPIKEVEIHRSREMATTQAKLKLNTDGSCRGDVATGGGLVRDGNGDVIVAFET